MSVVLTIDAVVRQVPEDEARLFEQPGKDSAEDFCEHGALDPVEGHSDGCEVCLKVHRRGTHVTAMSETHGELRSKVAAGEGQHG